MLGRWRIRVVLFIVLLIPFFLFWKIVVVPISDFSVIKTGNFTAKSVFPELSPQISQNTNVGQFHLNTSLFISEKYYKSGSWHPKIKIEGMTSISLGPLNTPSLGLPIFWLLLILLAKKLNVKYLLVGSSTIFIFMVGVINLEIIYLVVKTINDSSNLYILTPEKQIYVPHAPPNWQLSVLKGLRDTTLMFTFLILPTVLALNHNARHFLKQESDEHTC